ncbi:TetR/AcrR family transcriptional regulator [Epibacterium ulvae]|uniref:TetR/AcrR family transcriptional regulator n=1 Tax=Epibacterium ulvae TaxID=1156985 RepID=UPI0024903A72|nr:TetR/AcrR family transcriptional regulator [Epibacterium ulvae]
MPRPKSYNREDAVKKACVAFWEHGFQTLGVRELEQHVGINQFAIRSEFGGKEGLFLEALNFYGAAAMANEMAPMKVGGISDIISFLQGLVTPGSMTSSAFGCLMVNTGIENVRFKSPKLEAVTQAYWAELQAHFVQALKNDAQKSYDTDSFEAEPLAASLVTAVMGIHVQNRTQKDSTAGRPLVDLMCDMLMHFRAKHCEAHHPEA